MEDQIMENYLSKRPRFVERPGRVIERGYYKRALYGRDEWGTQILLEPAEYIIFKKNGQTIRCAELNLPSGYRLRWPGRTSGGVYMKATNPPMEDIEICEAMMVRQSWDRCGWYNCRCRPIRHNPFTVDINSHITERLAWNMVIERPNIKNKI